MTRENYDKPKADPALKLFHDLILKEGLYIYSSEPSSYYTGLNIFSPDEDGCGTAKYLALYPEVVGGYSGGNCWNDNPPRRYDNNDYPDVDDFILKLSRLDLVDQTASYFDILKFKKEKIETLKWTENEYYGNSTDYVTLAVKIKITNYNGEYILSLI